MIPDPGTTPCEVRVAAPAKVNPWLEILARRADGFHELRTLLLAIDLRDELTLSVSARPGVEATVEGPFATSDIPRDERNLAVRAAMEALARVRGLAREKGEPVPSGLVLHLVKNIPSQAGLGGASSDAAAAVHGVEALFGIDLGREWRRTLLASLGSDCVFFEEARVTGAALCKGRGEEVEACPAPSADWVLAVFTPETRCPTSAIYKALEFPLSVLPTLPTVPSLLTRTASGVRDGLANHLEAAASRAVPELKAWRELLQAAGADHFLLSGSGSSFFGIFETVAEAEATLAFVAAQAHEHGLALRGQWICRPAGGDSCRLNA